MCYIYVRIPTSIGDQSKQWKVTMLFARDLCKMYVMLLNWSYYTQQLLYIFYNFKQ